MKKIGKVSIKNYELVNKYKLIKIYRLVNKGEFVKIYSLTKNCDLVNYFDLLNILCFKNSRKRRF